MGLLQSHSKHSYSTSQLEKLVTAANTQIGQAVRPKWVVPPKKVHRLSSQQITDLIAQYRAGATTYALATTFGASRDTIRKHLRDNKVRMRRRGLSPEQPKDAVLLYRHGLSSNAIARKFEVSPTTVLRTLREQGITTS